MSKELRDREAFYKSLKREARHGVEREGIASLRPQLRETDAGPIVSGYATVYEVEYEVWDWLGAYTEKVSRGAATKTLAERPDVR
jgi:phage head maturation protease